MKKYMLLSLPLLVILVAFRLFTPITVKGKVTNHSGGAIPFATVVIKGTQKGTTADAGGVFSIEVPGPNTVLVITSAGYQTKEITVSSQKKITVQLEAGSASLQEVVVTGYGQVRKKDITGSVSRSRGNNLNGKAAGVQVMPNSYYGSADSVDFNTEEYDGITENPFHKVTDEPLSTFSIDVDAASYSNMRRFLNSNQLPPAGAIRTEELINYFSYQYPQPQQKDPFSVNTELSDCPWNTAHKLALIGLQGKKIPVDNLPPSNIVFLIDVSGSMDEENKLPLVQSSMKLLTDQLREQDKISIVVYAGNAGLVLPATSGANKIKIKEAIDNLHAGGSTAGGAGIRLAYKTAKDAFVKGGNNRIVLCTDGDFNVGVSSNDELEQLVEKERESGVFLTVLGYGMGNYKDSKMQTLADKGNGNHAYIDGMAEAKKVLVNEFGGTLFTIAKDVKLQIEFNPALVQGYRLIGYENRMLRKEDFNDDKKDAGELGSGHTVTALYEIIPVGVKDTFLKSVDRLKYSTPAKAVYSASGSNEYMTVKLRYKAPDGAASLLIERPVADTHVAFGKASENFRFASAVAEFGLLLRNSGFKSAATFNQVLQTARGARGTDAEGYRAEFIKLVKKASALKMAGVDKEDDDVVTN